MIKPISLVACDYSRGAGLEDKAPTNVRRGSGLMLKEALLWCGVVRLVVDKNTAVPNVVHRVHLPALRSMFPGLSLNNTSFDLVQSSIRQALHSNSLLRYVGTR